MSQQPEPSKTPLLDEWVADVGEQRIAEVVSAAKAAVEGGSIPGFDNTDSLVGYWSSKRRRSA